jgi:hypothetical protein
MKVILSASTQPYCNIAVRFGGAVINKVDYLYVAEHDALMSRQVYGKYMKLRKKVSFNEFLGMVKKDDYTFEKKEITRFKPDMFDGQ